MSKVIAINEIIEKKNLLRKCQEKHANYVSIDAILVWLNDIKNELEDWVWQKKKQKRIEKNG